MKRTVPVNRAAAGSTTAPKKLSQRALPHRVLSAQGSRMSGKNILYGLAIIILCFFIVVIAHKLFTQETEAKAGGGVTVYETIIVQDGDSLWSIAQDYSKNYTSSTRSYVNTLLEVNNLSSDEIHAGDSLILPINTAKTN